MIITADYIIQRRKTQWENDHDFNRDNELRNSIANELLQNVDLLNEVKQYPEKLIEMCFNVVDKSKRTVPFFLNDVQKDFIDVLNKTKDDYNNKRITNMSIIILKGRQQGFTTLITAYQLASILVNKNFEGLTVADETSNAETIFENKAKFVYLNLPDILKPTEKYNNKRQLLFSKLNSSWSVDTATKNMGRSRTINFLHGSECAFWQHGIASIQAGLGEALTKDSIKIYESTANGFNDYKAMWDSKQHINCFYEWWRTKEYQLDFENRNKEKEFTICINSKSGWIWERLKWLRDEKHLSNKQLYWYYKKYLSYIDPELIKQEYPCTAEEAFIASGKCIFNVENIIKRIDEVKEPIKTGFFLFDYDGLKIKNIKWQDDRNGFIKIYEEPKKYNPYVLGGDTAGEGEDSFTGHVLDNITGKQVAVLKHKFDEDIYARQMYCLGMYYKEALIGPEVNFSSYPTKELARLKYPNIYVRDKEDEYTGKLEKRYGFRTTTVTRPVILAGLVEIVREHIDLINDKETLQEMLTFVRNEDGKAEALEGYHDDLTMGLAISHYIRPQQSMKLDKKQKEKEIINAFGLDDTNTNKDFEMVII